MNRSHRRTRSGITYIIFPCRVDSPPYVFLCELIDAQPNLEMSTSYHAPKSDTKSPSYPFHLSDIAPLYKHDPRTSFQSACIFNQNDQYSKPSHGITTQQPPPTYHLPPQAK